MSESTVPASSSNHAFCEPLRISSETAAKKLDALKAFAKPTYSGYRVAAAVQTLSGEFIPGVNLEFDRHRSVCAEQSAVTLARHFGAQGIQALYVSDWPCGVCRQFLMEVASPDLLIYNATCDEQRSLGQLLPDAFEIPSKTDFLDKSACTPKCPGVACHGRQRADAPPADEQLCSPYPDARSSPHFNRRRWALRRLAT